MLLLSHLGHEPESGEEGPAEGVEAGVAVVGVAAEALVARVVLWTRAGARAVAAEDGVDALVDPVPVARVGVESGPGLQRIKVTKLFLTFLLVDLWN